MNLIEQTIDPYVFKLNEDYSFFVTPQIGKFEFVNPSYTMNIINPAAYELVDGYMVLNPHYFRILSDEQRLVIYGVKYGA